MRAVGGVKRIGEELEGATEGEIPRFGVQLQQPDGRPPRE